MYFNSRKFNVASLRVFTQWKENGFTSSSNKIEIYWLECKLDNGWISFKKILLRPGIIQNSCEFSEPGTFRSSVWRSPNWAISAFAKWHWWPRLATVTDSHINGSVLCVLCKNVAVASLFEYVKESIENKKKTEEPDKFLNTLVTPHLK